MPKKPKEDVPARIMNVATAKIRTDPLVQPRVHLNPGVIAEYCEAMLDGDEFPPVEVVLTDGRYLLVEGYLRFEAAKLANRKTLRCEVRQGDLRMALLRSAAANARHGLRRTWDDKRRAAGKLLADMEWSKWSDREIARQCSVSHGFVAQVRAQVLTGNVTSEERKFVTKHGTEAVMNVTAIGGKKTLASDLITIDGPPSEVLPSISIHPRPSETPGEVLSLSDFVEDSRAQFVAGLRQVEEILRELPPITIMRGDPTADSVLAKRLIAVSEKTAWMARFLRRVDSPAGGDLFPSAG
jgi:hypothetical protein